MFVGTLGYFPNADAAVHLCREVLPLVRNRASREVRVRIVGGGAGPEVLALVRLPGVSIEGPVTTLHAYYRSADLIAVPVRAGGGTRIKLLEALAHARPVVATPIGAEGIAADHGQHLLLADTPESFADACIRVLHDQALARSLGGSGRELVQRCYRTDVVGASLARLYSAVSEPKPTV